jgi:hypothetical protein
MFAFQEDLPGISRITTTPEYRHESATLLLLLFCLAAPHNLRRSGFFLFFRSDKGGRLP